MSKQESASSITCETKGKYCLEPGVDYLSNQLPLDTKMITSLDSTVLEITRRFSDPLVSSLVSTVPSLQATVTNRLFPIRSNLLVSRRERSIDRATEDDDNIISSGVAPLMLHRPSITDSEDSASSLTYEQISPLNRKALNLSNTNNSNIDIGIKKRELIFEGITELIHVIKERMQKEQWTRDLQEYSAEQSMLPEEFVPLNEYLDDSMTRYGSRVIQTLSCSRKRPCWALVGSKMDQVLKESPELVITGTTLDNNGNIKSKTFLVKILTIYILYNKPKATLSLKIIANSNKDDIGDEGFLNGGDTTVLDEINSPSR